MQRKDGFPPEDISISTNHLWTLELTIVPTFEAKFVKTVRNQGAYGQQYNHIRGPIRMIVPHTQPAKQENWYWASDLPDAKVTYPCNYRYIQAV